MTIAISKDLLSGDLWLSWFSAGESYSDELLPSSRPAGELSGYPNSRWRPPSKGSPVEGLSWKVFDAWPGEAHLHQPGPGAPLHQRKARLNVNLSKKKLKVLLALSLFTDYYWRTNVPYLCTFFHFSLGCKINTALDYNRGTNTIIIIYIIKLFMSFLHAVIFLVCTLCIKLASHGSTFIYLILQHLVKTVTNCIATSKYYVNSSLLIGCDLHLNLIRGSK